MRQIVLASASPRRKELIAKLGLKFKVDPGDIPEHINPDLDPFENVMALSREKAIVVARKHPNSIIIAADTLIAFENRIMGKPADMLQAKEMLRMFSGKYHSVITGLTIVDTTTQETISEVVETRVHIKQLTDNEIEAYVKTAEPLDKAGGYAIQGLGSILVDRIEGDYYNVVGLPLFKLAGCLKKFGIAIL